MEGTIRSDAGPQNNIEAILLSRLNRFSDILHRMKKEESELSSFLERLDLLLVLIFSRVAPCHEEQPANHYRRQHDTGNHSPENGIIVDVIHLILLVQILKSCTGLPVQACTSY